jgi:hypothetical protein
MPLHLDSRITDAGQIFVTSKDVTVPSFSANSTSNVFMYYKYNSQCAILTDTIHRKHISHVEIAGYLKILQGLFYKAYLSINTTSITNRLAAYKHELPVSSSYFNLRLNKHSA